MTNTPREPGPDRDHERDDETDAGSERTARGHARGSGSGRERRHAGRKGRILHTRVSEELSADIRRLAEDLRVPTSNLVRNVLEDVFSVVERVSEDVGEVLEDVFEEADGARERLVRRARERRAQRERSAETEAAEEPAAFASHRSGPRGESRAVSREPQPLRDFSDVLGWQPLVLNRDADCAACDRPLGRGERAHLGMTAQGLSQTTLCDGCIDALSG